VQYHSYMCRTTHTSAGPLIHVSVLMRVLHCSSTDSCSQSAGPLIHVTSMCVLHHTHVVPLIAVRALMHVRRYSTHVAALIAVSASTPHIPQVYHTHLSTPHIPHYVCTAHVNKYSRHTSLSTSVLAVHHTYLTVYLMHVGTHSTHTSQSTHIHD